MGALLIKIGTLGKMTADFARIEKKGKYVIAAVRVTEGMQWEVVSVVGHAEVWRIIKAAFKPSIIWFLIWGWVGEENTKTPKL